VTTTAEIKDAALREQLGEAERLLDEERFRDAVERCADAYLLIMRRHPELRPPPSDGSEDGPLFLMPPTAWPVGLGLRITFDAAGMPHKSYEKERFTFSAAATYFEFVLDLAARAERA
jgi:hypothetical protein